MAKLKNQPETGTPAPRTAGRPPMTPPMPPAPPAVPGSGPANDKADLDTLPVVGERWYVKERRPAYINEQLISIPEQEWVASPYFDTEEEANDWLALYQPDEGNEFTVAQDLLREITIQRWLPA